MNVDSNVHKFWFCLPTNIFQYLAIYNLWLFLNLQLPVSIFDSGAVTPIEVNLTSEGIPFVTEIILTFVTAADDVVEVSELILKACNTPSKTYTIYPPSHNTS